HYIVQELKAERQINMIEHPVEFPLATSRHPRPETTLQGIRHYIRTHLKQQLTIEKVAQQMYMSPRQFTRQLRQQGNQSFVDILNECRMEEARRLLTDTQWSIATISTELGFVSPAYFNVFFKRHQNCTPGAYRRKS